MSSNKNILGLLTIFLANAVIAAESPTTARSDIGEALKNGKWADVINVYDVTSRQAKPKKEIAKDIEALADEAMVRAEGSNGAMAYRVALLGFIRAIEFDPESVSAGDKLLRELLRICYEVDDQMLMRPLPVDLSLSPDPNKSLTIFDIRNTTLAAILRARPNSGEAHACRAWIRILELVNGGKWKTAPKKDLDDIQADINSALDVLPETPRIVMLASQFEFMRSKLVPDAQADFQKQRQRNALGRLATHLARHPKDVEVAADLALWRLRSGEPPTELVRQYAALKIADKLVPGNFRLSVVLALFGASYGDPKVAEDFLKKAVDRNPGYNLAIWQLTQFQGNQREFDKKVANLQLIVAKSRAGNGLDCLLNELLELAVLEELPDIELHVAAARGPRTAEGKAAIASAKINTSKLRERKLDEVWILTLEGKALLMEGELLDALDKLKQADSKLATLKAASDWASWRDLCYAKLTLSEAYALNRDSASAIKTCTELLDALSERGMADFSAARFHLAKLQVTAKDYKAAVRNYEILYSKLGPTREIIENWAEAYKADGNMTKADEIMKLMLREK